MKLNSILSTILVGSTLAVSSLTAGTVKLYDTSNDGTPNLNGGEFKAVTSSDGTFLTFCLEQETGVAANGTTYYYTISDSAFNGGPDSHNAGSGDPISKGTAYLFQQFVFGTLVDSDGVGNYNDHRDFNAGMLQAAFWYLEDEDLADDAFWTNPLSAYNLSNNYYIQLVAGIYGISMFDAAYDNNVKAINLWSSYNPQTRTYSGDVQSQLIYVPDSGMTALLLGLGLLSLAAVRRKL
jgi:hypothetical protein